MTHKFVVNTEKVNEYGYRVLTAGIDIEQFLRNPIVLYGHNRATWSPENVIGKVVNLTKENNELIAEIEFDTKSELAKEVEGKVARGFIRMSSLHADVVETSIDKDLILPGQTLETVTKCKLVEISIVDIGGNDDALKLSKNGYPVKLQKLQKQKQQDMSLKTIALAMGLQEDAPVTSVMKEITELTLAKEKAENKAVGFETELKEIKGAEADALIDKAVILGLIPEGLKTTQRAAFDTDFTGQKAILSKLITDKEAENNQNNKHQTVKEIVLGNGKGGGKTVKLTFDYLQKHDVAQLRKIRDEQPDEYVRLAKEYGDGVRHKED